MTAADVRVRGDGRAPHSWRSVLDALLNLSRRHCRDYQVCSLNRATLSSKKARHINSLWLSQRTHGHQFMCLGGLIDLHPHYLLLLCSKGVLWSGFVLMSLICTLKVNSSYPHNRAMKSHNWSQSQLFSESHIDLYFFLSNITDKSL